MAATPDAFSFCTKLLAKPAVDIALCYFTTDKPAMAFRVFEQ